ncbi:MAG: ABC transporter ATP-binding protein, partial [Spirochaetaceae bacterium]
INAVVLITPQVVRIIVDGGIRNGDQRTLTIGIAALLLLVLVRGVLTFVQGRLVERSSQGVAYDLRRIIHERLTSLSFSFHDTSESGQLLSRSVQDVERIRFLTGRASLRLIEGSIFLVTTAVVMVAMNPTLALLALVSLPILAWRGVAFGRIVRPLSMKIQEQLAVMTTRLEQNLRGARIVKGFAQEDREIERFDRENDAWLSLASEQARVTSVNGPMFTFIVQIATVGIVGVGGFLIVRDSLTFGELVAFMTYLAQLAMPVRMIGMIVPVVGMAMASGERIFEIVDATSEVREDAHLSELPQVQGHVTFQDVSFAYPGRGNSLHGVDIEAKPGEVIALLGETGSGKSTVVNLIPRFYDVTSGCVRIDGYDVRRVRLSSLRSQIGIVLQESTLFATTIRENIRYGRPDAGDGDVEAAARAAQAHEFIAAMSDGYNTKVGELGKTLSGGQRQRVAIARALLKDPRILVLDDATSSVDSETEHLIQLALERLMSGRTSFVIAQRLSTLRMADRILVLEEGRVAAQGSHDELWDRSELYRAIYERQMRQEHDRDR